MTKKMTAPCCGYVCDTNEQRDASGQTSFIENTKLALHESQRANFNSGIALARSALAILKPNYNKSDTVRNVNEGQHLIHDARFARDTVFKRKFSSCGLHNELVVSQLKSVSALPT